MNRRELVGRAATLAAGAAIVAPTLGMAATDADKPTKKQPWPLRGSESFTVQSKAIGDSIAVGVWQTPVGPTSSMADSPVKLVYALDGSFTLQVTALACAMGLGDIDRPGFPRTLLVGLDYPEDQPNARTRDYIPPDSGYERFIQSQDEPTPEQTPGGAPAFLRFLTEELDPMIREKYPVSDAPAAVLGDSAGGAFTHYAFVEQSPLFDCYWLGSPAVFTSNADYVGRFVETLSKELVHETRMFLSLGAVEMNSRSDTYREMGASFNRMVYGLRTTPNPRLTWQSKVYPDHTHTSIVLPALNDAVRYLLSPM